MRIRILTALIAAVLVLSPGIGQAQTTNYMTSQSWSCAAFTNCMDVYNLSVTAGTEMTISVTNVTGGSVAMLALFEPGEPLNGTNILTGADLDRECVGQNTDDSVTLDLLQTGIYQLTVIRDWGSSAGSGGNYDLQITSDIPFTPLGPVLDDIASQASGTICVAPPVTSFEANSGWSCAALTPCQDVYDVYLDAGTELSIAVDNVTGDSVLRLAVFEPGDDLFDNNLLTGQPLDRMCFDQDESDILPTIFAPQTGTYRIAVGRDWDFSAGSGGTYRLTMNANQYIEVSQTEDDIASQAAGTTCVTQYEANSGWTNCANFIPCQDIYDLDLVDGTELTFEVDNITGSSALRLALFAPGQPLSGINLLTGTTEDRMCFGQDVGDLVSLLEITTDGTYRLAVGRDWDFSAGASGTYRLRVDVNQTLMPTQTADDIPSEASGTTCGAVTGTPDTGDAARMARLRAHPNPFEGRTTLAFSLEARAEVRLEIYSIAGRRVRTVVDQGFDAGDHRYDWDGADDSGRRVARGVYLARLTVGEQVTNTERIVVLR